LTDQGELTHPERNLSEAFAESLPQ
jgi:hypothetical protein